MTKKFSLSENNQPIFDEFAEARFDEIIKGQISRGKKVNERSAHINVAQYKEVAIALDNLCDDFRDVSLDDVLEVKEKKPHKNNHLNGFLMAIHKMELIELPPRG